MSLAEKRFANYSDFCALRQRSEGCSQARATGADDQYIVVVGFEFCAHKSLRSVMAPLATSRTYKSVRPTMIRLIQAYSM